MYGSLRSGFRHPAYEYISKYFTLLGEAKAQGLLYDAGEYPAAIPAYDDRFITGELYELKETGEFDWAMEQLDDYEGMNPDEAEPALFIREASAVLYNGRTILAWMYWYNQDITGQPLIASGDIFDYMNKTDNGWK